MPSGRTAAPARVLAHSAAFQFILRLESQSHFVRRIYRTEAFREVGGFDEQMNWGEDWEIWLRLARTWEVGYVASPSALYRIHRESTTATAIRQNRLCYGYDAVFRRAAELCDDPEVLPLLRRRILGVSRLYAASAFRQIGRPGGGSLDCCRQAVRALLLAAGARGRMTRKRPASRRGAPGWL